MAQVERHEEVLVSSINSVTPALVSSTSKLEPKMHMDLRPASAGIEADILPKWMTELEAEERRQTMSNQEFLRKLHENRATTNLLLEDIANVDAAANLELQGNMEAETSNLLSSTEEPQPNIGRDLPKDQDGNPRVELATMMVSTAPVDNRETLQTKSTAAEAPQESSRTSGSIYQLPQTLQSGGKESQYAHLEALTSPVESRSPHRPQHTSPLDQRSTSSAPEGANSYVKQEEREMASNSLIGKEEREAAERQAALAETDRRSRFRGDDDAVIDHGLGEVPDKLPPRQDQEAQNLVAPKAEPSASGSDVIDFDDVYSFSGDGLSAGASEEW